MKGRKYERKKLIVFETNLINFVNIPHHNVESPNDI
jgi:hypothetical protein